MRCGNDLIQLRHIRATLEAHSPYRLFTPATKEAEMMNQGLNLFAEALVFVHGCRAETEAARHAALCEKSGDTETADTWRKLQSSVRTLNLKHCPQQKAA
jgi:hypothetical protein